MPRTTSSIICHPTLAPLASNSIIQHPTPAHTARQQPHHPSDTCTPARRQPHPAEIRRWRRQSVQMGRKICVCLSSSNPVDRCNPWRDISSGVGNSSAQTVDAHVPREWEAPQAKRGGGMERSGSLCGRVAAPRETLHGRQSGSIGKQPAGQPAQKTRQRKGAAQNSSRRKRAAKSSEQRRAAGGALNNHSRCNI